MKLYYGPGACSLAPHIVAREAGIPITLDRVDWKNGKFESGELLKDVNPKGYVPVIRMEDGTTFTETGAMIQYIADQAPAKNLSPAHGSMPRYRMMEWINYISTELHKGFSPLWNKSNPDSVREATIHALNKKFTYLDAHFANNAFLLGDSFSAADAYLFTVMNWKNFLHVDTSAYPKLNDFMNRVASRPAVQAALRAERLTS